jgi:hypothetical protein
MCTLTELPSLSQTLARTHTVVAVSVEPFDFADNSNAERNLNVTLLNHVLASLFRKQHYLQSSRVGKWHVIDVWKAMENVEARGGMEGSGNGGGRASARGGGASGEREKRRGSEAPDGVHYGSGVFQTRKLELLMEAASAVAATQGLVRIKCGKEGSVHAGCGKDGSQETFSQLSRGLPPMPPQPQPPPPPLPFCPPDWAAETGRGAWEAALDGTYRFGPRRRLGGGDCRIRRFSAGDAIRCLANRHVLLMGDSLTRYQYLALASMVNTGAFVSRQGIQAALSNERGGGEDRKGVHKGPHLCMPAGWGSWREHYLQSSAFFEGREMCQCWRPEGIEFFKEHVENRFFHEPSSNISISYIQVFGRLPVHGFLPVSAEGSHILRPELYGASEEEAEKEGRGVEWDWEGDAPAVLEQVLGEGFADVLVFNTGLWGEVTDREYIERLLSAGERAVCPARGGDEEGEEGGERERDEGAGRQGMGGEERDRERERKFKETEKRQRTGLCLWRTTSRRFVCDTAKEDGRGEGRGGGGGGARMWDKYDRACPRRDWIAEDVGDAVVRQRVAERARLGGGWELLDVGTQELGQVCRWTVFFWTRSRSLSRCLSLSLSLSGCSCSCSCRFCCYAFSVLPRVGADLKRASERARERQVDSLFHSLLCCRGCLVQRQGVAGLKGACGQLCHAHIVTSGLVVVCLVTGCVCGSRASASVRVRGNDPRAAASHLPPG